MYRPRNQKPSGLDIIFNVPEQMYETPENGLLYCLPFALLENLKHHYKYNHSVKEWYQQLDNDDKKKVVVLGKTKEDNSYNDGNFIE